MGTYAMFDTAGKLLQEMSFAEVLGRINGQMRALERTDLLSILVAGGAGTDVRMGTTATVVDQGDDTVSVRIGDGPVEHFDLVVAADGIHSATRAALTGDPDAGIKDWGYTAFTWWVPDTTGLGDSIHEYWGPAGLFGMYPLATRVNAIAGMPTPEGLDTMEPADMASAVTSHFGGYPTPVTTALEGIGGDTDNRVYPWPMVDQRADQWIHGRVALLGDAACGFLPTAGVGASNAMKSAAVLADELGRSDAATVPQALGLWEQRVRKRVEANQDNSRTLAKMMFVKGHTTAKIRDLLLRHYPVEKVAADVLSSNVNAW
jgi:2-polyprenyl-6-methoxyphenol hydroxylase-like FAD-dependent oxidoreductase